MSEDVMSTSRAPSLPLHKGFVVRDGVRLHYRRMGIGPAVVLLHASPCSSKVMEPIQRAWAGDFTTFAFDLPGFGLSDPIEAPVTTERLADAIAAAVRALGIERASFYGRHTGAGIAVEIANRHPTLASFVLADGFPVFPGGLSEDQIEAYLPAIDPTWDGSHLVWTWYRYREQHIFWPWNAARDECRADTDMPDIRFLYRGTVELLQAAATYRDTYASALRHAGLSMIADVVPPVCYGNRPGDSMFATVEHYPPSAWVHIFPREFDAATNEELQILKQHATGDRPSEHRFAPTDDDAAGEWVHGYVTTTLGSVYSMSRALAGTKRCTLFLHEMPGGCSLHRRELDELSERGPVLAVDLAGNGYTEFDAEVTMDLLMDQLIQVLDSCGLEQVDIHAHGTAAAVATEFAIRHAPRVSGIVLRSPPVLTDSERSMFAVDLAPDISPSPDGSNFLRLWHHLRDQRLWWPWHDRRRIAARSGASSLAPVDLHEKAVVLLQQPERYRELWHLVINYPLEDRLQAIGNLVTLTSESGDLFVTCMDNARRALGGVASSSIGVSDPLDT